MVCCSDACLYLIYYYLFFYLLVKMKCPLLFMYFVKKMSPKSSTYI